MLEWIVSSSVLILMIAGLRFLLKGKIGLKLQYALWLLVLVRLLVPIQLGESAMSLVNSLKKASAVESITLAGQVERFTYHADGTVTGYGDFEKFNAQTSPLTFTPEEAERITKIKTTNDWMHLVWYVGMAVAAVVFVASNVKFSRFLKKTRKALSGTSSLPVYITPGVETPCLFGIFRPSVYLPPEVAEDSLLSRHALAHEETHYRHGDTLWAVLRCLCLILHWYNPLVWWAAMLSRADGELACDEATIARLGENCRREYGSVLIELTCRKPSRLLRAATMMTGSRRDLKERITLIARKPKTAVYALILVILVALIGVGCTFTGEKTPETLEPAETTEPTETVEPTEPSEETQPFLTPTGPPSVDPGSAAVPAPAEILAMVQSRLVPSDWVYQAVIAALYRGPYDSPEQVHVASFLTGEVPAGTAIPEGEFEENNRTLTGKTADVYRISADNLDELLGATVGVGIDRMTDAAMEGMRLEERTGQYYYKPDPDIRNYRGTVTVESGVVNSADNTVYADCRAETPMGTQLLRLVLAPRARNDYYVFACLYRNGETDLPPALEDLKDAQSIAEHLGYNMDVAPEGAEDIAYQAYSLEGMPVAETSFSYNGANWFFRMGTYPGIVTDEIPDISGNRIYYGNSEPCQIKWCEGIVFWGAEDSGMIVWVDRAPGLVYNLWVNSGVTKEALLEMAEMVFVPVQDSAP